MVVLAEKGLESSICGEKRRITIAKVPFPDLLEMLGGIVLLVIMTKGCGLSMLQTLLVVKIHSTLHNTKIMVSPPC